MLFKSENMDILFGLNKDSDKGFPGHTFGKESTCQCRKYKIIPGLGTSSGGGNSTPLLYPCLENPSLENLNCSAGEDS